MSINNINPAITQANDIYADYKFNSSYYTDPKNIYAQPGTTSAKYMVSKDSTYSEPYSVPLESLKAFVYGVEVEINKAKDNLEKKLLKKIYIDPYADPNLEQAHFYLWKEACRYLNIPDKSEELFTIQPIEDGSSDETIVIDLENSDASISIQDLPVATQKYLQILKDRKKNLTIAKDNPPDYISFDEYLFAERYQSTASRRLIQEYHDLIAHSTFSHLFQLRKILDIFLKEVYFIKKSLVNNYGEVYENESQQKIAVQYDAWAKMALHYTIRVNESIKKFYSGIPDAEVDKITKAQAAKLQAFFAIRINAVDSEANDLIASIERDVKDNGEIFYTQYLDNALRISSEILEPLEFDFITTSFSAENPMLSKEVVVATNFIKGNYASILADYIDRYSNILMKTDAIFDLISEKRKYCKYLSQLSTKSVKSKKILKTIEIDNYGLLFNQINIDTLRNDTFVSSHSNLDDLEHDSHPQYLLKEGGMITGNVSTLDYITIDGVDISHHRHTGNDGSLRISSLDIDYSEAREQNKIDGSYVQKPISVQIDSFIPDILTGGIPVFDTIIAIEMNDDFIDNYEYEISYIEVD